MKNTLNKILDCCDNIMDKGEPSVITQQNVKEIDSYIGGLLKNAAGGMTLKELNNLMYIIGADIIQGDCDLHYSINNHELYVTCTVLDDNGDPRKLTDEEMRIYGVDGTQELIHEDEEVDDDILTTTITTF